MQLLFCSSPSRSGQAPGWFFILSYRKYLPVRSVFIVFAITCLGSCSDRATDKKLSHSDSLVINFNAPQTIIIEKTVSTTEKKAIKKLARFVSGKPSEAYKCGYDGNMLFFEKGELTGDISFNYSEACRHFITILGGKLTPTFMSNEAADFLKSLAEGKNWY